MTGIDIPELNQEALQQTVESKIDELETKISKTDKKIKNLVKRIKGMVSPESKEMSDEKISYDELKAAFIAAKIPQEKYEEYALILGVKAISTFVYSTKGENYGYWLGIAEKKIVNRPKQDFQDFEQFIIIVDSHRDSPKLSQTVLRTHSHSHYGNLKVVKFPQLYHEIADSPYWLDGFNPSIINTNVQSTGPELAKQLAPMNPAVSRFHNTEQIENRFG